MNVGCVSRENEDESDTELVEVGSDDGISVLETIELEDRVFGARDQISTHISISTDLVKYIRAVSLITSQSEMMVIRGMMSYGKTYLYKHMHSTIETMREYEINLIVTNKFVREVITQGIPSPVRFNKRERVGIRLVSGVHGALLHIADEMHLDRTYVFELSIWTAFKKLFDQDNTIYEMFKDDIEFNESLRVYDRLETIINGRCADYEGAM